MTMKDDLKFMVDKRTSRREHADDFTAGIWQYRRGLASRTAPGQRPFGNRQTACRVYIRKRPLFRHEAEKGEYDTVTCVDDQSIVLHKCNMKPDLKHMFITHKTHRFHGVFDERARNRDVYDAVMRPVLDSVLRGHTGTLLMYGQTGSGKTYTIQGMVGFAIRDLFARLPRGTRVSVSCLELLGHQCFDLLNDRALVTLRDDAQGQTNIAGLVSSPVQDEEELLWWVGQASADRTSSATHINAASSRSHFFIRVTLEQRGAPPAVLSLVDLAGSERNEDSFWHDADRRKEGAKINASLAVLKQCIRLQAGGTATHVPYRQSELTRLLRDSFTNPTATSALIATVSPAGVDTEHSLDTLAHAAAMACTEQLMESEDQEVPIGLAAHLRRGKPAPAPGAAADLTAADRVIPPSQWSAREVQEWLRHISDGLARMPTGTNGMQLVRMSRARFVQACDGDEQLGGLLFDSLQEQVRSINQARVANAKASRQEQVDHRHEQSVKAAGLRYVKAPSQPTVQQRSWTALW
eukprot:EG_transcript_6873